MPRNFGAFLLSLKPTLKYYEKDFFVIIFY